jgi:DNA-binding MarR family transcriptional regulator
MGGMSDGIGFLLSDTARLMKRAFDTRARALGVTRPQWRALFVLSRREGLNQGALADHLEVEPITLCRMVDRLEEAGHVERRRDPGDRRAWNIYLTDRSRPLIQQLKAVADDLAVDALAGIDAAERAALIDTLTRLRSNLLATKEDAAHG